MKYKCIIIDDEQHAIDLITEYVESLFDLKLVKTYTNPLQALAEISSGQEVDFIFLDINIPGLNGLELGKMIRNKTRHLVLTTGHLNYAVESYQINASNYLLKPIKLATFTSVVNELISKDLLVQNQKVKSHLFIKAVSKNQRLMKIMTNEIIAIEVKDDQLFILTINEKYVTNSTLKEMEQQLTGTGEFIKPNRAYLISTKHIAFIEKNSVEMSDKSIIKLGKAYKDQFLEDIEENMFRVK